jgi:alpha-L-rhamnosidase
MKSKRSNIQHLHLQVIFIFLILTLIPSAIIKGQTKPEVTNLRTEYKTNPIGIDVINPRLSWEIFSQDRNIMQSSFRIKAALSEENLESEKNLIWNTGKVSSDQSIHLEYNGPVLQSGRCVYWKVKVWDNKGRESEWSETAFWEMGLLDASDWEASWIEPDIPEVDTASNPCPFLRKEFRTGDNIKEARVYISSRGLYQLYLNGEKVGDQLFTPGWTSYKKRMQYQVYDVTGYLNNDRNAIGVILGDGWYRGFLGWNGEKNFYGEKLALILQLKIIYKNGKEDLVVADKSWKASTGPILKSDIYNGEVYDARLKTDGWNKPEFKDKNWNSVIVKDYSKEMLVASEGVPVRITQVIKPVSRFITPGGELVFDLGQNIVGWVQLKLKGKAGTKITIRHAEVLDREGNFYTDNLRAAKQEIQYIFRGKGEEIFEPHFTFQGFRYFAVKDYPGKLDPDDFAAKVIHSDMISSGNFKCSDTLINRLQKNIQWGLRGNFLDIPTDCPQRDERLGWTGDAQAFAPTACFNMDAASFYTKWMKDFIADQKEDGRIPWVIPNGLHGNGGTGWGDGTSATGWADATLIIPWTVYQVYNDTRILDIQYESMKGWVEYMRKQAGNSYLYNAGFHFGDWLAFATTLPFYPGATTDNDLIATAYFYYSTGLLQKTAVILGKYQDSKDYRALMQNIKNAFQKEFITPNGRLSSNTQTAYVLALAFNLIPENLKEIAAKRLAEDVKKFGHITTGFLGTPLICDVLTDNGYTDLAYMLLFRKEYPSWLYPVTKGATTIWERWDGIKPDGTFQDPGMNSFNHYAYGAVGNWLYTKVAGIQTNPETPGYKKIIINPHITEKLNYAKAEYHSVYGKIVSYWQRKNGKLKFKVVIPANTTTEIHIPAKGVDQILENNTPVSGDQDIKVTGIKDGRVILETGSGEYNFEVSVN